MERKKSISKIWGLGKSQAELDFVDIDVSKDTPLYLDPYALTSRKDSWSNKCEDLVVSFFDEVLKAIVDKNKARGIALLSRLNEPTETYLGVSLPGNKGRGIGPEQAVQLYSAIKNSKAAKTGLIQDLSDFALFIPHIGRDKISDITTNVLRGALIEYTQQQCHLMSIPMSEVASGFVWEPGNKDWVQFYTNLPIVKGKKVILVPKYAVRFHVGVDYGTYYDRFVVNFLRAEHLRAQDALVHTLKNGNQMVYKKDLIRKYPKTKEFITDFSEKHPDVIEQYRKHLKLSASKIPNINGDDFDEADFARFLGDQLNSVKPGDAQATEYHRLCIGIISFLFFPNLINPQKEAEINEGRKRIDILYTNAMENGVFYRMANNKEFNANLIPVECKNYSKDPKNPEFDQLLGRFSRERGKLGIMLYRTSKDKKAIIARCRDAVLAGSGCILPIDDDLLRALLEEVSNGRRVAIEKHIDDLYRLVSL